MWFLVKIAHFKKLKQFLLYAFFLRKQKTRKPRTKCIHFVINYPYFKIHNWFCTNSCNSCSNPHQDWAESSVNWFRKKLIYQNWFPKFKHFDWVIAKLVLIWANKNAGIREISFYGISWYKPVKHKVDDTSQSLYDLVSLIFLDVCFEKFEWEWKQGGQKPNKLTIQNHLSVIPLC